MRILALDIGERKIGIAVSDLLGMTAQPMETLVRKSDKDDFEYIEEIAGNKNVSKILIGLPLNLNGSAGPKAKEATAFAGRLKDKLGIPVQLWDERLSTLEANRILLQADVTRKKRKKLDDKMAAQLILQSYLDSRDRG